MNLESRLSELVSRFNRLELGNRIYTLTQIRTLGFKKGKKKVSILFLETGTSQKLDIVFYREKHIIAYCPNDLPRKNAKFVEEIHNAKGLIYSTHDLQTESKRVSAINLPFSTYDKAWVLVKK